MEYVRICDVYGAGFFYIPGTETCLQIGGYMRYRMDYVKQEGLPYVFTKTARFAPSFDVRSETEWGTLRGFAHLFFEWNSLDGNDVYADQLFMELQMGSGTLLVGKTDNPYARFFGDYGAPGEFEGDFAGQIYNSGEVSYTYEAANGFYMSGGKLPVPVTYHCLEGVRGAGAPQHSQSPHAMLWNAPGIEIVMPAMASDVYGLIRTAIQSPNPTMVFSHAKILGVESAVSDERAPLPFGKADIKRKGRDVTIVALSIGVHHALEAAELLAQQGIDAEVVDPRTLVPFDEEAVLASVEKTGRLVVVDEMPLRCSSASEIAATVAEKGFQHLKAPVQRVTRPDVPVPFSPPLEQALTPDAEQIVCAVRRITAEA